MPPLRLFFDSLSAAVCRGQVGHFALTQPRTLEEEDARCGGRGAWHIHKGSLSRRRLQKGGGKPRYLSTSESFSVSYLETTHQLRTSTTHTRNTMASNNALQVNEGVLGDPPYLTLTRQDVRDDEDFAKITSRLSDGLMGEAPHPDELPKQWKNWVNRS